MDNIKYLVRWYTDEKGSRRLLCNSDKQGWLATNKANAWDSELGKISIKYYEIKLYKIIKHKNTINDQVMEFNNFNNLLPELETKIKKLRIWL